MQEGDAFSLGTNAGLFIDQREAGGSAPREGGVQIIHVEADVVNARPAFVEELSDRRLRFFWLQEFNERIASGEPSSSPAMRLASMKWAVSPAASRMVFLMRAVGKVKSALRVKSPG